MGYDRGLTDFNFLNQIEFHLVQKIERKTVKPRSCPIRCERKWKYSFTVENLCRSYDWSRIRRIKPLEQHGTMILRGVQGGALNWSPIWVERLHLLGQFFQSQCRDFGLGSLALCSVITGTITRTIKPGRLDRQTDGACIYYKLILFLNYINMFLNFCWKNRIKANMEYIVPC